MANKKVLGRGLGAFFPDLEGKESKSNPILPDVQVSTSETSARDLSQANTSAINTVEQIPGKENTVLMLNPEYIRANPHQPRKEFDSERLEELAESIQTHGLIQPITVRYIGEQKYELISGERRLRASKLAGITEIPAYIRFADDEQSMAFALIENIQREDLNPLEVALAYQRLLEEFNYTQSEVANKVGKNRTTVTNMLRLLQLPDFIQKALAEQSISGGHARALLGIESELDQIRVLKKIIQEEWSVRKLEAYIRDLNADTKSDRSKRQDVSKANTVFIKDIENKLRSHLGTKVSMKTFTEGGEIRIKYFNEDDLDRLLTVLIAHQ
jgi:ParB family chromosome partitioning protein